MSNSSKKPAEAGVKENGEVTQRRCTIISQSGDFEQTQIEIKQLIENRFR
jgi:hypothetical protein